MELYIARHGQTHYNAESRFQGSGKDSPLTPEGKAQAHALGKAIKNIQFDAIYTSPLGRAVETVQAALGEDALFIYDPRLVEIGLGAMEGMQWDEAIETYPQAAGRLNDPVNYSPPPGGEALSAMIDRISAFMDDVTKAGHNRVFVLTHGYTMRVFEACVAGKTLEALAKTAHYGNCQVVRYKFDGGKWIFGGIVESCASPGAEWAKFGTPEPVPAQPSTPETDPVPPVQPTAPEAASMQPYFQDTATTPLNISEAAPVQPYFQDPSVPHTNTPHANTPHANAEPPLPNWHPPKSMKTKRFALEIEKTQAPTFVLFAFITALLYTISFTGIRVYPQLSFFIFCGITIILLNMLLKRLGWLNHPRAFLWAIPLMIFAGFNMVFGRSVFTYINVAVAWVLFAFIIFGAIYGAKYPFGALFFWVNIAKVIRGNVTAGVHLVTDTSSSFKLDRNHPALRFLLGIAIAIPLLIVIVALMISADQVFAAFINNLFDGTDEFNFARFFGHFIVVVIATVFAGGYVYKARFMHQSTARFNHLKLDKIIAVAFLLAINLLFLFFCYIQLAYLFMGGFNTLPDGVIFAEYAREGFFQLLFLTIINFSVIIFFLQVYSHHARTGVVRIMLVLLVVFTGVLIASSFYRMNMYMQVFGFTPLRMAVITFLVMEVLLCGATFIALYRDKFDVMRVYLVIGMVFLVVANVSASGFVSGRLNANLYRRSTGFHFTKAGHFWNADIGTSLIEIYRHTNNPELQRDIRWRLQSYYNRYIDEPWQNRSIIKRANLRQINRFFESRIAADYTNSYEGEYS